MNRIVGQENLVYELNRIFKIFKSSNGMIRPHFFLAGQSGSGKTYTVKQMCEGLEIPFVEINCAQITKEGTSGNSISKALAPLSNMKGKPSIVFADEFDKLFISGNSNSSMAHETTLGVQNEFLKVLEADKTSVYGDYGKYIDVDITKTLFVFAGAFNNEEHITLDKLRSYGVKTEFLGRVGLIYNANILTLDNLLTILEGSPLLEMYLKLFPTINRNDVVETIMSYLKTNHQKNDIGARIVNTLLHQYFIKDGKLGVEDVKEITFQEKLTF